MSPEYDHMMERIGNSDLNKTGNVRITYNEARSLTHCSRRKAINITYFECVFVFLA